MESVRWEGPVVKEEPKVRRSVVDETVLSSSGAFRSFPPATRELEGESERGRGKGGWKGWAKTCCGAVGRRCSDWQ